MLRLKYNFIIYTILIGFCFSNPALASNENQLMNNNAGRPSGVPENYVTTPVGYFHPDCINVVEEGESVNSDGTILQKDGSNRNTLDCSYPRYTKNGDKVTGEANTPPIVFHSWSASISRKLSENNGLVKVTGEWEVPGNPHTYNGQTLFAFNSIRTANTIIQPVLGFNQSGAIGPQWSIASWAVTRNQVFKSNNTHVQHGDIIRGEMTRDIPNGVYPKNVKKWNISIAVIRDKKEVGKQSLTMDLSDSSYNFIDEGAYETYRNQNAVGCLEIAYQADWKKMKFIFSTKHLVWRNDFDGPEKAHTIIYDHDCGVKASISKNMQSEITF